MTTPPPLPCRWTGDSFEPASPHWARQADQHFVVGQIYPLEIREERSPASHKHYFSAIAEAHRNLPEEAAERLPTPEHLRRFALIKCGYRDERTITCNSRAEALRVASFIRPMDEFALVVVAGNSVSVFTAKSQSMRAMNKATFAASKDAVLAYLAEMLGTTPRELAESEAA